MRSLIVVVALAGLLSGCAQDAARIPLDPDVAYAPKEPESEALQIMKAAGFAGIHDGDRLEDTSFPPPPKWHAGSSGPGLLGLAALPLGAAGIVSAGTVAVAGTSAMVGGGASGTGGSTPRTDPYFYVRRSMIVAFVPQKQFPSSTAADAAFHAAVDTAVDTAVRNTLGKNYSFETKAGDLFTDIKVTGGTCGAGTICHLGVGYGGTPPQKMTTPQVVGGGKAYLVTAQVLSLAPCSARGQCPDDDMVQKLSEMLPSWAYVYAAPDTVIRRQADGVWAYIKQPMLLHRGQTAFFVTPPAIVPASAP
ncbi:MAG: hypothetical protein M0Z43_13170 [Acidithiobacillus sp.]|nr:hypothetical protein [Acidithiobacillus sp.]